MKFVHDGKLIELHGDTIRDLHVVSLPQLRRMLQTDAVSEFFHIHVEPPPPTIPNPSLEIHSLLHKFAPIFQPPTTLPPRIVLFPPPEKCLQNLSVSPGAQNNKFLPAKVLTK